MKLGLCIALLLTTGTLCLSGTPPDGEKIFATVYDWGSHLSVRLVTQKGLVLDAQAARAVVETAEAGGKKLESIERKQSTMKNEVRRSTATAVTWIYLNVPVKGMKKIDVLGGKVELFVGGKLKEIHTTGFRSKRSKKINNQELKKASVKLSASMTNEKLLYAPGTGSQYSNMAFDTMGDVIAKAAGMSFDDYVRTHIFAPLGMRSTSFIHAQTPVELRTTGHSLQHTERIDLAPCPVYPYNRRHAPSSTLNANVEDMCRWMLANLARGELDGKRILKSESYDEMWSREDDTPQIGLSWFLSEFGGKLYLSHSGGDTGFNSFCGLLPTENLGLVVMVNSDMSQVGAVARFFELRAD